MKRCGCKIENNWRQWTQVVGKKRNMEKTTAQEEVEREKNEYYFIRKKQSQK